MAKRGRIPSSVEVWSRCRAAQPKVTFRDCNSCGWTSCKGDKAQPCLGYVRVKTFFKLNELIREEARL